MKRHRNADARLSAGRASLPKDIYEASSAADGNAQRNRSERVVKKKD
ncbi:hypothetical protein [uncultured Sphingobacterium sp.]|nr:hypothetical protein [uncultured Sphingobacterium sp.]